MHVLYVHIALIYVSLSVREAKQGAQSSYAPLLVPIAEREETDCQQGLEPDASEHTTNSLNSNDVKKVQLIAVFWA